MDALAVVFLAVSVLSFTIQAAGLRRMLSVGAVPALVRRGMLRTAASRVAAAVTYVALATAGLVAQNAFPIGSVVVFTAVQVMWIVNARLDVQLRRRLDSTATPPLPRRAPARLLNLAGGNTVKVDLLDLSERVGWTFVQAVAGSVVAGGTAITLATFDWRAALAGGGAAAAISLLKVLGVSFSSGSAPAAGFDFSALEPMLQRLIAEALGNQPVAVLAPAAADPVPAVDPSGRHTLLPDGAAPAAEAPAMDAAATAALSASP